MDTPASPHPAPRLTGVSLLLTGLTCAVLAAVSLWPLPLHWSRAIPGAPWPADGDIFAWNIWWFTRACGDPALTLAHCPLVQWPFGFDWFLSSHALVATAVGAAMHGLGLTIPAALNTLLWLNLFSTGLGMALVAARLSGSRAAAVLAMVLALFFPTLRRHTEILSFNIVFPLPFALLIAFRWLETGRLRWALALGAVVGLAVWHDMYVALWTALFAVFGLLWASRAPVAEALTRRRWLGQAAAAAAVGTVVMAWPVLQMLAVFHSDGYVAGLGHERFVLDLQEYFLPEAQHPLWRQWLLPLFDRPNATGAAQAAGFVPLALALGLLFTRGGRRRLWPWYALWLALLILACGTGIRIAGRTRFGDASEPWGIPMPYALLKSVPPFDNLRAPVRFLIPAGMVMTLLAACGARTLLDRMRTRAKRVSLLAALLALSAVDFMPSPILWHDFTDNPQVSLALDARLRAEEGAGTVLDLPIEWDRSRAALANQIQHGQRVFTAHLSRWPLAGTFRRIAGLRPLTRGETESPEITWHPALLDDGYWRRLQWQFDITHILTQADWSSMELVPPAWQPALLAEDKGMCLFRLRPPEPAGFDLDLAGNGRDMMHFVHGFDLPDAMGVPSRRGAATVLVRAAPRRPARVGLVILGPAWHAERIGVDLNGQRVSELETSTTGVASLEIRVDAPRIPEDGFLWITLERLNPLRDPPNAPRIHVTRLTLDLD